MRIKHGYLGLMLIQVSGHNKSSVGQRSLGLLSGCLKQFISGVFFFTVVDADFNPSGHLLNCSWCHTVHFKDKDLMLLIKQLLWLCLCLWLIVCLKGGGTPKWKIYSTLFTIVLHVQLAAKEKQLKTDFTSPLQFTNLT